LDIRPPHWRALHRPNAQADTFDNSKKRVSAGALASARSARPLNARAAFCRAPGEDGEKQPWWLNSAGSIVNAQNHSDRSGARSSGIHKVRKWPQAWIGRAAGASFAPPRCFPWTSAGKASSTPYSRTSKRNGGGSISFSTRLPLLLRKTSKAEPSMAPSPDSSSRWSSPAGPSSA